MEKLRPNCVQLFLCNKFTVFTMGGTVALRSVNKIFVESYSDFCILHCIFSLKCLNVPYVVRIRVVSRRSCFRSGCLCTEYWFALSGFALGVFALDVSIYIYHIVYRFFIIYMCLCVCVCVRVCIITFLR